MSDANPTPAFPAAVPGAAGMGASSSVIGLTLTATLGGLLFGYDTAVISGAVRSIDVNFINPLGLAETARDSLSGFTVASALFGCVIGGAVAGLVADRLGRRRGLILAAALFLLSAIGSALPELGLGPVGGMGPDALWPFITYRILGGIAVGIASMLSPLYIAEIAPPGERGRLISLNQMAIVLGIVGVYFVNWAISLQGDDAWLHAVGWRMMLGSEALPAALFLILLLRAPDTPRWLVMKGRVEEARQVLHTLGDQQNTEATLTEIRRSLAVVETGRLFSFGVPVVVIGVVLSVFQQLVGINAVLYYAPLMFQNMGAATDSALLQTVVVGTANVLFTLVAMATVDRWGRRPLLLAGSVLMSVSMLTLGFLFGLGSPGLGALLAVVVYIAGFAMSWGPVVWILLSEMFPNPVKGKAMALAVAAQWVSNLLVSWSFKVLDGNSTLNLWFNHGFSYYLYGLMAALSALFVLRYVPETKGRSLESIQEMWADRRRRG